MVTPVPSKSNLQADNTAPGVDWIVVTASATPFAAGPSRAIYVGGTGGDITLLSKNGNSVNFTGVGAGSILPFQAVSMTATTASMVAAIY